jgi:hypothetical protein
VLLRQDSTISGKSYRQTIPLASHLVKSWTIYDLVEDWVSQTRLRPGFQVLLYLLIILTIGLLTALISAWLSAFPSVSFGTFVVLQLSFLLLTIVLHELCHGLLIKFYGGIPTFGMKWMNGIGPVMYATTAGYYRISAYKNIAAAPLIMLSTLSIMIISAGYGWWVLIPFIFNAIGSGGDLLSLRVLRKYPVHYYIKDTKDGFTVYEPTEM